MPVNLTLEALKQGILNRKQITGDGTLVCKEYPDKAIEGEFSKLAHQSWRGDNMEIKPLEGKQLFASINANGQVLADHAKVGNSLWSKLQDLNISLAAIQDTRLQDPDKQTAAERQARMLADGHQMAYSWSKCPTLRHCRRGWCVG